MRICLTMICVFWCLDCLDENGCYFRWLFRRGSSGGARCLRFFGTEFVLYKVRLMVYLTPVGSNRRNGGRLFITKASRKYWRGAFFIDCFFAKVEKHSGGRNQAAAVLVFLYPDLRIQARRSVRLLQFCSTIAADFLRASSSSRERLISRISSTPAAPSLTGTPI